MKYSDLIECMHQYRAGLITRAEMIAAIALWQRPVDCAPKNLKARAIEAIIA